MTNYRFKPGPRGGYTKPGRNLFKVGVPKSLVHSCEVMARLLGKRRLDVKRQTVISDALGTLTDANVQQIIERGIM